MNRICKITATNRRFVGHVKKAKMDVTQYSMDPGRTEIDSHADSHSFVKNFKPIYFTSKVCMVSPFLDECSEQVDVLMCLAATAVDLDGGDTLIMIFGQGLWFGNCMEKSLICPNQCRAHGINICADLVNPHRNLSFIYMAGTSYP